MISVVIPCYNQKRWLNAAIESVRSVGLEVEIIVVDDGSDEPVQIENQNCIKIFRQRNLGVCVARNKAIERARGDYILTLDSDDLLGKDFLVKAKRLLDTDKSIMQVCGRYAVLQENGLILDPNVYSFGEGLLQDQIMACNLVPNVCLFRKKIWEIVGGYSLDLNRLAIEDVDFTMKIHALGFKSYFLNDVACLYRQHGMSRNNHAFRRINAKFHVIWRLRKWYIAHPRYILPFLMWKRFGWMVENLPYTV